MHVALSCIVVLCIILSVEHIRSTNGDLTCELYRTTARATSDTDAQRWQSTSANSFSRATSLFARYVMRMFNSKELGDHDYKLIPTTISITNAGFAPGWHHRRSTHHISFPPMSLLVLESTRRHENPNTNRDTRLKPIKDFTAHRTQSELNLLTQLHSSPRSSPSCQYVFRVATELPKTCSLAASGTFALHPPTSHLTNQRSCDGSYATFHEEPFRSPSSLHRATTCLLLHYIVITGGGVL